MDLAAATSAGLTLGAAGSTLGFGLRHGADLDHIAALSDLAATSRDRRRSAVLSACYVAGHAAVLTVFGTIAILFGASLPAGVDDVMGRVVGVTLLLLGVYVLTGLVRNGTGVRLRSRWMLLGDAARWTGRAARTGVRRIREHRHPHETGHHADLPARVLVGSGRPLPEREVHDHDHVHLDEDVTSRRAAVGIGMLHGVGGETPTQVLLFITVAGVGGVAAGMLLLLVFLAGLVISNTGIALVAGLGIGGTDRSPKVFAVLAGLTAAWSLVFGTMLVVGRGLGA